MTSKPIAKGVSTANAGQSTPELILNVDVPAIQAKKKVKFPLDKTVKESIQTILRNIPVPDIEYLALCLTSSGIWMEDNRKLSTYMLSNEDHLELKTKKMDFDSKSFCCTISVYHENSTVPEMVKVYDTTTIKGIIQSLENKKYFMFDRHSLFFNGIPLDNLEELASSKGIQAGSILEYRRKDSTESIIPGLGTTSITPMSMKPARGNPMMAEMQNKQLRKATPTKEVEESVPNNELLAALERRRTVNPVTAVNPTKASSPTLTKLRPVMSTDSIQQAKNHTSVQIGKSVSTSILADIPSPITMDEFELPPPPQIDFDQIDIPPPVTADWLPPIDDLPPPIPPPTVLEPPVPPTILEPPIIKEPSDTDKLLNASATTFQPRVPNKIYSASASNILDKPRSQTVGFGRPPSVKLPGESVKELEPAMKKPVFPQTSKSAIYLPKSPSLPPASPKQAWAERFKRTERELYAPMLLMSSDSTEIRHSARKLLELLHPQKPGNKDLETYLRDLDKAQLTNLLGCLSATIAHFSPS